MTVQTVNEVPVIEWDDSVVFVFSWSNKQFFGGFVHLQISAASATGIATQIGAIQTTAQTQVQAASDPQSWLDTVKNAKRATPPSPIAITFDDSLSTIYTTLTGVNFTLQQLFSLAG
jgi:hypothetical protein